MRPYVPEEYVSNPVYNAPNDEEEKLANAAKYARRQVAALTKQKAVSAAEAKILHQSQQVVAQLPQTNAQMHPKTGKQRRKRSRKGA